MKVVLFGVEFDAIALYGAGLATLLAIFQIRQTLQELSRDKRSVHIKYLQGTRQNMSGHHLDFVSIHVVNTGHRPIEISSVGFPMSDNSLLTYFVGRMGYDVGLPRRLEDGEAVDFPMAIEDIRAIIKRQGEGKHLYPVYAAVWDTEGKRYAIKIDKALRKRLTSE